MFNFEEKVMKKVSFYKENVIYHWVYLIFTIEYSYDFQNVIFQKPEIVEKK